MAKKFAEYSNFNLSDINKEVLKQWEEKELFLKSVKTREGAPTFVFYEGPPSANGMPGIHHVMARSIKDIFCRYKTMKGFHVKRKAGGVRCREGVKNHQRRHREEDFCERLQQRLSHQRDEVYQGVD